MKTREEITQSNKLIAEFMGLEKVQRSGKSDSYMFIFKPGFVPCETCPASLEYDSSWDWLMPVVKKIQQTAGPLIDSDLEDKRYAFLLFTLGIVTPIETVYMYVVNYINWYNESIGTKSNKSM